MIVSGWGFGEVRYLALSHRTPGIELTAESPVRILWAHWAGVAPLHISNPPSILMVHAVGPNWTSHIDMDGHGITCPSTLGPRIPFLSCRFQWTLTKFWKILTETIETKS